MNKKVYSTPFAEKIEFDYHNQIMASSTLCHQIVINEEVNNVCVSEEKTYMGLDSASHPV